MMTIATAKQNRKKNSASVLSMVTVMVLVLSLAGIALLRLGMNARINAVYATSGMSARAAADAGLIQAGALFRQGAIIRLYQGHDGQQHGVGGHLEEIFSTVLDRVPQAPGLCIGFGDGQLARLAQRLKPVADELVYLGQGQGAQRLDGDAATGQQRLVKGQDAAGRHPATSA